MIPIRRTGLPPELSERLAELSRKILAEEQPARQGLANTLWNHTTVRRHVYGPLRTALWAMAHGIEACMYCGRDMADTVDHFVPVAQDPVRTFCWFNHLLACSTCNSRYKRDVHEVDALGNPKLIDPTREDPFDHLHLNLDTGCYLPRTERGRYTCDTCGLNAGQLPRARVRAVRQIESHLDGCRRAIEESDGSRLTACVAAIRGQPFADVCQAMLRQSEHPAAKTLFAAFESLLPVLRRGDVRAALLVSHDQDPLLPPPRPESGWSSAVPAQPLPKVSPEDAPS